VAAPGNPEQIICALLRREAADWHGGTDPTAVTRFLEAGSYHGVLPLLHAEFNRRRDRGAWPEGIVAACRERARAHAIFELARRSEVERVLQALALAGVRPLLLKGIALAYSHYPGPALRPRADADLLIPPRQRQVTLDTLDRLGYATRGEATGGLVSYQANWSRTDDLGVLHLWDVHWRISDSHILAKSLGYEELHARARPIPALGPHACALAPVDALLHACIHRAGHVNSPYYVDGGAHLGGDRLIWLYDIHLLVSRMSAAEMGEFAALAASKQIRWVCLEALRQANERFATPIPGPVASVLSSPGAVESSARYLRGGRMRQMAGEFLALGGWRDRARWVREVAFPSAGYMRWKYPDAPKTWLPLLYLRRGAIGMARLLLPDAGHRH
jgi:hypothetical protein